MNSDRIPKHELADYAADVKSQLLRQIRRRFKLLHERDEFTQSDLAARLGVNKAVICRRLQGENDMRVETMAEMARGLDCRVDVTLTPIGQVTAQVDFSASPFKSPASGDVIGSTTNEWPAEPSGR